MTPSVAPPRPSGRRLRRALLRHRRLVVAGLLGLAVASALTVVAPAAPTAVRVVAAGRDLPAGALLGTDDLVTVDLPVGDVPDGAFPEGRGPVGRLLSGPLRRGEVLTDARLVGQSLLTGTDGLVALPVRLGDPAAAAYLGPGDLVDLLAVPDDGTGLDPAGWPGTGAPTGSAASTRAGPGPTRPGAEVVAHGVRVLAGPPAGGGDGSVDGAAGPTSGSASGLIVVALSPMTARLVAAAQATGRLAVALVAATTTP